MVQALSSYVNNTTAEVDPYRQRNCNAKYYHTRESRSRLPAG